MLPSNAQICAYRNAHNAYAIAYLSWRVHALAPDKSLNFEAWPLMKRKNVYYLINDNELVGTLTLSSGKDWTDAKLNLATALLLLGWQIDALKVGSATLGRYSDEYVKLKALFEVKELRHVQEN